MLNIEETHKAKTFLNEKMSFKKKVKLKKSGNADTYRVFQIKWPKQDLIIYFINLQKKCIYLLIKVLHIAKILLIYIISRLYSFLTLINDKKNTNLLNCRGQNTYGLLKAL